MATNAWKESEISKVTRLPVRPGGRRAAVLHSVLAADAQLVARCRTGDPEAWREFVERFSSYVYAISVRRFRLSDHDAEDVFQEVFARAYERLHTLRNDSSIRPWLGQLTNRLCVDRLRMVAREETSADIAQRSIDEGFARRDDELAVREALRRTPEQFREILDRFFVRDESYHTIGEALDLPTGTVASRISRGLDKLREAMC
jgi:RNA polymerase sigma factor (sigma-70 family)